MAGRKTRSTNEILVDILNELAEHTDSEHGLTVKELSNRVGATEKTVHAHCSCWRPSVLWVGRFGV